MAWREDGTGYGAYPVSALIRPPLRTIWELRLLDMQGNTEVFETTDDHPGHVAGDGHSSRVCFRQGAAWRDRGASVLGGSAGG